MRDWKQRRPDSTIGPHDLRVSRLLWGIVEIDFVVFITEYSGSLDFVLRGKLVGFSALYPSFYGAYEHQSL